MAVDGKDGDMFLVAVIVVFTVALLVYIGAKLLKCENKAAAASQAGKEEESKVVRLWHKVVPTQQSSKTSEELALPTP